MPDNFKYPLPKFHFEVNWGGTRMGFTEVTGLDFETEIIDMTGSRYLERVRWRNNHSGVEEEHAIGHVFLLLGAIPNTEWLSNCIELDSKGFIVCGKSFDDSCLMTRPPYALETSRPHIFAVGDARAGSIKRVASAVGEGSMAVKFAHEYLASC